jgi:predicted GIY-YIG superfamily endonuclease
MIKYSVYWYKLTEHTDKYSQGYIGITNDLKRRHKEHKYSANPKNKTFIDTHFTRAINKYGLDNIKNFIKKVISQQVELMFY